MEYDVKIEGHVVYYELDNGKTRAMIIFDNFETKLDAFNYVSSVIKTDTILDFAPPHYDETIH